MAFLWAGSMTDKFNEGRNVIDLSGHPGNAQPDISELVSYPEDEPTKEAEPAEEPEETATPEVESSLNVLLLGSDIRPEAVGTNDARSDTIMVAHLPQDRDSIQILSLPRDMWVPIPGHGNGRINSAFQKGGAGLTMATIEDLFNITIDHVVMVDFDGFAELTTALDGVTVNNPQTFTATHGPETTFHEGEITLEGDQALQYVRERRAFPDSDLTRVQNQQRVVRAVVDELLSSDTLTNPGRMEDVLDTMLPHLSMDEDLTAERIIQYGLESTDLRPENITSFTVPTNGSFITPAGADVLATDDQALADITQAFREGTLDEYAETQ